MFTVICCKTEKKQKERQQRHLQRKYFKIHVANLWRKLCKPQKIKRSNQFPKLGAAGSSPAGDAIIKTIT